MRCIVQSRLAYFSGSKDRTVVACGGSSKHLVGYVKPIEEEEAFRISSLLYYLSHGIRDLIAMDGEPEREATAHRTETLYYAALLARHKFNVLSRTPLQRMEMVAKTLDQGSVDRPDPAHVLLGTPLYVALAETESEKQMTQDGALI